MTDSHLRVKLQSEFMTEEGETKEQTMKKVLFKAKQRQDWGIPDPKNLENQKFREIRNLIENKILNLINEIKNA